MDAKTNDLSFQTASIIENMRNSIGSSGKATAESSIITTTYEITSGTVGPLHNLDEELFDWQGTLKRQPAAQSSDPSSRARDEVAGLSPVSRRKEVADEYVTQFSLHNDSARDTRTGASDIPSSRAQQSRDLELRTVQENTRLRNTIPAVTQCVYSTRTPCPLDKVNYVSPVPRRKEGADEYVTHFSLYDNNVSDTRPEDTDIPPSRTQTMKSRDPALRKSDPTRLRHTLPAASQIPILHKENDTEIEDMVKTLRLKQEEKHDGEIKIKYHCLEQNGKGKVIVELGTDNTHLVYKVPARIVLLVDKSGSMLHKCGRQKRYSKITTVKRFAQKLVDCLDDGDQAGVVTFGDTAEVMLPLETLTSNTRSKMKKTLDGLDKTSMSLKTNLSAGLSKALDIFKGDAPSIRYSELVKFRNAIIVCSDGDVNEGTTDAQQLVQETRMRIRQMAEGLDDIRSQWVTISVVTTGGTVSEAAYLLSKLCSSDAYYYVDSDVSYPEDELFLPVLLRKSAVAYNVSVLAESQNGVPLLSRDCTQENKTRVSQSCIRRGVRTEKAYFFYDFPVGTKKHIGLVLDLTAADIAPDKEVLKFKIEYFGTGGKARYFQRSITRGEIGSGGNNEAVMAACMHEARVMSQEILHRAADHVKVGKNRESLSDILEGKSEIQKLCEQYGELAESEEDKIDMASYIDSVVQNMHVLIESLETSMTAGQKWSRIKAVSSAITRESPNVSNVVRLNEILCPLPNREFLDSLQMQNQVEYLYSGSPYPKRYSGSSYPKRDGSPLGTPV